MQMANNQVESTNFATNVMFMSTETQQLLHMCSTAILILKSIVQLRFNQVDSHQLHWLQELLQAFLPDSI